MRKRVQNLVLMTAVAAGMACAQETGSQEVSVPTVVVYLENGPLEVYRATKLAEQMFASVGVRIVWRTTAPSVIRLAQERPIVVDFASNTPASDHPGTLAYSLPYEGIHITVFYDRVRAVGSRATQPVLAHVLVHEITHLMQGTVHHSEGGIMKAHWTNKDYAAMAWQPLSFAPFDIELIKRGLAARAAHRPDMP
jgi:hypothetical protein